MGPGTEQEDWQEHREVMFLLQPYVPGPRPEQTQDGKGLDRSARKRPRVSPDVLRSHRSDAKVKEIGAAAFDKFRMDWEGAEKALVQLKILRTRRAQIKEADDILMKVDKYERTMTGTPEENGHKRVRYMGKDYIAVPSEEDLRISRSLILDGVLEESVNDERLCTVNDLEQQRNAMMDSLVPSRATGMLIDTSRKPVAAKQAVATSSTTPRSSTESPISGASFSKASVSR